MGSNKKTKPEEPTFSPAAWPTQTAATQIYGTGIRLLKEGILSRNRRSALKAAAAGSEAEPRRRPLEVGDYIVYKNDYYLVSGTLRKLDRVFIQKHLSGKEKNMKRAELESSCRIITDPLERKTARLAVRSKPKKSRRIKPKRGGRRVPTHRSVSQST